MAAVLAVNPSWGDWFHLRAVVSARRPPKNLIPLHAKCHRQVAVAETAAAPSIAVSLPTVAATDVLKEASAWMTDELVRVTQAVWSKLYGREVPVAEAHEILLNVRRLAGTLAKLKRGS